MRNHTGSLLLTFLSAFLLLGCTASVSYIKYTDKVDTALKAGRYDTALKQVKKAKKKSVYKPKDRLLYYLDHGIVEHYAGNYTESNVYFDKAEQTMEVLFTKSVSQIAGSYLLNDNVTDYSGEIYENIYLNVFKALNYIALDDQDAALVEVRKVNLKLRELEDKYGSSFQEMSEDKEIESAERIPFYSDALAHYLSALLYLSLDEADQSLISERKLQQAWESQPQVYDFPLPENLLPKPGNQFLCVLAFTGTAPKKNAVGGKLTTYEDYIGISDLSMPVPLPNLPFPGAEPGLHFKFSFPVLQVPDSEIESLEIMVDGKSSASFSLLENMGRVAEHTFESRKKIIYLKTVIRTVTKGLAAAEAKKKLKEETDGGDFLNSIINMAVDAGVDATEDADLRCWRTMPQKCFVGMVELPPGEHQISAVFFDESGNLVEKQTKLGVDLNRKINLIEFISLK